MLVLLVGGTFGGLPDGIYLQIASFQEHDVFSRKLFMNQKIAHTILSVSASLSDYPCSGKAN